MTPRISGLALMELGLAGAIFVLGLPMTIDAFHELALDARLNATQNRIGDGRESVVRLEDEVARTASEQKSLAFALLGRADDPTLSEAQSMGLIRRAETAFRDYVGRVPGDGAAWAGLASAELAKGDAGRAAEALRVSILAAPWSPSLVAWRCGLGIDLFRKLDDEGRELMKGQFRLQAQRSVAALVKTVTARNAVRIARILLATSPDELIAFEAELGKRR